MLHNRSGLRRGRRGGECGNGGFVIGKRHKRHRAREFLDVLKEIDARVPEELDVPIVMDKDTIHKTASVKA